MTTQRKLLICALFVVGTGVAVAVATTGSARHLASKKSLRASQGIQTSTANPWVVLSNRVTNLEQGGHVSPEGQFTELETSMQAMPRSMRLASEATLGERHRLLRLRFDRARYVVTGIGIGLWVVKGKGVTCIFEQQTAAAACGSDSDALRHGLVLVTGKGERPSSHALPKHFVALGIVRDGVKAVRLQVVGGTRVTVPVAENAFGFQATRPIGVGRLIR